MNTERMAQRDERQHLAEMLLKVRGFRPVNGYMRFEKGERVYDLSAADLNQMDRIEREGLFVVKKG